MADAILNFFQKLNFLTQLEKGMAESNKKTILKVRTKSLNENILPKSRIVETKSGVQLQFNDSEMIKILTKNLKS